MNETAREVIGDVEQLAIRALFHQPIDFDEAEEHFRRTAGEIAEKVIFVIEPYQLGRIAAIISAIVAKAAERRSSNARKGHER